eukprot:gene7654-biopygen9288
MFTNCQPLVVLLGVDTPLWCSPCRFLVFLFALPLPLLLLLPPPCVLVVALAGGGGGLPTSQRPRRCGALSPLTSQGQDAWHDLLIFARDPKALQETLELQWDLWADKGLGIASVDAWHDALRCQLEEAGEGVQGAGPQLVRDEGGAVGPAGLLTARCACVVACPFPPPPALSTGRVALGNVYGQPRVSSGGARPPRPAGAAVLLGGRTG